MDARVAAGGPPPRPTALWHWMTAIWALMALAMGASLPPDLGLVLAVLAFGALLGLIWTVQMLRVLHDREARNRLTLRAAAAWAVCPATGLLLTALVWTGWPIVLRVKLSEPALVRLAEEVKGGRSAVAGRFGTGLVPVYEAHVEGNCVVLSTGVAFLDDYGLAYSRDGRHPAPGDARYRFHHLFGPWYTFVLDVF